MAWEATQETVRAAHWQRVEDLLGGLPARLAGPAKLLEYDLALAHGDGGRFRDVFVGVDRFPLPFVGPWLLADLAATDRADHPGADVERHLFAAAILVAGAGHLATQLADDGSFAGAEQAVLASALSSLATAELAASIPPGDPFWTAHAVLVGAAGDDLLARLGGDPFPGRAFRGPARLMVSAALAVAMPPADRDDLADRVESMVMDLAATFGVVDELATFHRDARAGRTTRPIAIVAETAGMALDPWPGPDALLGALALSRAVPAILDEALDHVRESRRAANELGLPTFASFTADLEERVIARRAAAVDGSTPLPRPARPLLERDDPPVPRAVAMARAALLADPTFAESWETHREGMFGAPLVVSRFPEGLVLEILAATGQDVGYLIDGYVAAAVANRFRYFDHPDCAPDSDTIGVVLRLVPRAGDPEAARRAVRPALAWVDRAIRASGHVPVWLRDADPEASTPARPVVDLGEDCGTVAANLLLGLLATGWDAHREAAEIGARALLRRIVASGVAANVNYPRTYALGTFIELVARLSSHRALRADAGAAGSRLAADLAAAVALDRPTPQEAALLLRACRAAAREDLVSPGWRRAILRGQRFDGLWPAEPFAAAPNRGRALSWYASATLTTVLCYEGLARE